MGDSEEKKNVMTVFSMYCDGVTETIDGADVKDAIRALNLNPTMALVTSLGGTTTRGEVQHSFEDFWKIYESVKNNKDQGGFTDFVECLKIYDVGENGFMKLEDLNTMLLSLGENLSEAELNEVMKDCQLEEENEEGWFPYLPFLCRLCEKPVPKDFKPAL